MSPPVLFPAPEELALVSCAVDADAIALYAATIRPAVACPNCGTLTRHVHSRYRRSLTDLPWHGVPVRLHLRTRRFFCRADQCPRRIFAERLPGTALSYARRTLRLSAALRAVALALGGEAGQRLLPALGMAASGDTLLRRLRSALPERHEAEAPRVLGVDDWAWKKGHRYGTLLVDLERRRVVDLLPDRSADSFAAWLEQRPSVEVISRDRSNLYAEGATRGAPHAVQVADRWHLLRSLTEAVERALEGRAPLLREAATAAAPPSPEASPEEWTSVSPTTAHPLTRTEQVKASRRARRLARYNEVVELRRRGQSLRAVAREVGVDVRTIRRWLGADGFPERKERPAAPSKLDAYRTYLDRRLQEGCTNAAQLWRELRACGFDGGISIVRTGVRQMQSGSQKRTGCSPKPPSLRQTAWLIVLEQAEMKPRERAYVEALMAASSELARVREVAQAFRAILRERHGSAFEPWSASAEKSLLRGFAASLRTDLAAVRAAIELPWSNGQTEGQVNRLKLIKRSMYGRASFEVLRARVLHAA